MSYTTNCIQNFHLILASNSPRRSELLKQAGYTFSVFPADIDETRILQELHAQKDITPGRIAKELAKRKAAAVRDLLIKQAAEGKDLSSHLSGRYLVTKILAADTLVSLENEIFGKPNDKEDAFRMLSRLSGSCHQVFTGYSVITLEEKSCGSLAELHTVSDVTETGVFFYPMSTEDINWYITTGEPMDKAGSYGIQGLGARFIRSINGDYNNVVGLPLANVCRAFSCSES